MIITALVTPYDEKGKIDYKKVDELLSFQEINGVDGVVLFGSTGEGMLLSMYEKYRILLICKKYKKLKMIINVGSNNTMETRKNIKRFSFFKPYAFLVVTPYYLLPNEEGIIKHYQCLEEYSDFPMIIYNVPSRTSIDLSLETIKKISKFKNIIGIKEASKNRYKLRSLSKLNSNDFMVFLGNDEMFVREDNEIDNIISTLSNVIPNAFISKDIDKINKYLEMTSLGGNPQMIKEIMCQKGMIRRDMRLPLIRLSEEKIYRVKKMMEEIK